MHHHKQLMFSTSCHTGQLKKRNVHHQCVKINNKVTKDTTKLWLCMYICVYFSNKLRKKSSLGLCCYCLWIFSFLRHYSRSIAPFTLFTLHIMIFSSALHSPPPPPPPHTHTHTHLNRVDNKNLTVGSSIMLW